MDRLLSEQAVIDAVSEWLYDKTRKESIETVIKAIPTAEPTDENLHREREQAYMQGYEDASKRFRLMPCEDAISRQVVLDVVEREQFKGDAISEIEKLPPVKPQPKTGHWVAQDIHNCHTDFKCSECGYIHNFMHLYGEPIADYTYCPNCGAKMVEPQERSE